MVIVGDAEKIYIPELPRMRESDERLRGLRLLHTHLSGENLSQDDGMDLVFLRLDSVAVLQVSSQGIATSIQYAFISNRTAKIEPDQKSYEVLEPTAIGRDDIDLQARIESLEESFQKIDKVQKADTREKALLISVSTEHKEKQEQALEELAALADTAGIASAGFIIQRIKKLDPKHILGKGKLTEVEIEALSQNVSLLLFEQDLLPSQSRNLAELTERRVLDRTQLILDIFAQHATTKAGKLQVELAQLQYSLPRLVGKNKAMSKLMGGIGGRGPGETKLEIDRRRAQEKMQHIKKELLLLRKQRTATRQQRAKASVPVVALVGYTNAGKSTLLNTLTGSTVLAEDKLFATLDPTSRRIRFPQEQEVVLTDTVGFIRRLPPDLQEAFKATLEELESANVFILVVDSSHKEAEEQFNAVQDILHQMDLAHIPQIIALNKWEMIPLFEKERMRELFPNGIPITAKNKKSLTKLIASVQKLLPNGHKLPEWQRIQQETEHAWEELQNMGEDKKLH